MLGRKKGPKIAIVEDDPYTLSMLGDAFEGRGFSTTLLPGADGDFLEQIASAEPDIISMDIMIAEGTLVRDGFDAIALLKGDLRTADIPIMVLSNFFEEHKVEKARALGAVDFINITGNAPTKIPDYYLQYLEDPKNYRPSHPHFRRKK